MVFARVTSCSVSNLTGLWDIKFKSQGSATLCDMPDLAKCWWSLHVHDDATIQTLSAEDPVPDNAC